MVSTIIFVLFLATRGNAEVPVGWFPTNEACAEVSETMMDSKCKPVSRYAP